MLSSKKKFLNKSIKKEINMMCQLMYANEIYDQFYKLEFKVREQEEERNTFKQYLTVGTKEQESKNVNVRERGNNDHKHQSIVYNKYYLIMIQKPQEDGPLQPFDLSFRGDDQRFMELERAQNIQDFVKSIGKRNFEYEFQYLRQSTETKEHDKQLIKTVQVQRLNRYTNILPFSHSIVKPEVQSTNKFSTPRDKFYINANYIKGVNNAEKQYIATQGPIPESVDDFWHMIWTNNVGIVIMLCALCDRGRIQCERYWPNVGQKAQFGPYEVNSISQEETPKTLFRNRIILKCQDEQREIIHYQWTGWIDFGVVDNNQFKILDMLAEITNVAGLQNKRPVIHCSAGVGRTGTFLAICHLKQLLINKEAKISVFSIVRRLREQRALMIQTPEQYQMVYRYTMWVIENLKYI